MSGAILVAGLGRCGTSLTMQMLAAGGVSCVGIAPSFEDERTMSLPGQAGQDWLRRQSGKALKLLDPHRFTPAVDQDLRVIWLDRDIEQQTMPQAKFVNYLHGVAVNRSQRLKLRALLQRETVRALRLLSVPGRPILRVAFEDIIARPFQVSRHLAEYLSPVATLDAVRAASAVLARGSDCTPDLAIEMVLIDRAEARPA